MISNDYKKNFIGLTTELHVLFAGMVRACKENYGDSEVKHMNGVLDKIKAILDEECERIG